MAVYIWLPLRTSTYLEILSSVTVSFEMVGWYTECGARVKVQIACHEDDYKHYYVVDCSAPRKRLITGNLRRCHKQFVYLNKFTMKPDEQKMQTGG